MAVDGDMSCGPYLDRVPDDALYSLAEVLFAKIDGGDRNNGSLIAILYRAHSPTAGVRFVDGTMRKLKGKTGIDATCYTLWRFYCTNLAELFGVSRNTIGNWVNDSKPKPDGT